MHDEEPPRGRRSPRDADNAGYEPLFTHDNGQSAREYRQSYRDEGRGRDGRADSAGRGAQRDDYSGRGRSSGSTPYGDARDGSRSPAPRPRPTPGGGRPEASSYGAAGRSVQDRGDDRDQYPSRDGGDYAARDYPAREYGAREYPAREYGAQEFPAREYGAREYPAREYGAGRDDHADAAGYAGGGQDGYADPNDPYAQLAASSSWSGSNADGDGAYGEYGGHPHDGVGGDDGDPPDEIGRHRRRGGDGGGRRPSKRWVRYTKRTVAVLGVLVLLAGGYVFYEYKRLDSNIKRVDVLQKDDKNIRNAEKQRDAENFLLIGSDTRAGANKEFGESVEGARSDTTILAHLSPGGKKAILVSFPRDAWVDLPSCQKADGTTVPEQKGQFNSAFSIGGANCTILAVQKLTGIAVTHYVQIDFTGFSNMVHALGGVTVCSTKPVNEPVSGLKLEAGDNNLDGAQALAYVRARKGLGDGSDIDRIERQQRFLGAMMRKATSGDTLFNPIKLQRFLDAATKSVTMDKDTGLGDLKDLASVLHGLDPARVNFVTPPIANRAYDPNDPSNQFGSRVLLDDDGGRQLYDSIINDKPAPTSTPTQGGAPTSTPPKPTGPKITVAPGDVRVYVYNGTGTDGLAGEVRDSLSTLGFNTVSEVSSLGTGTPKSEVHYGPGKIEMARTLGAAVPGSVLVEDSKYAKSVALVLGSNYSTTKAVQVGDTYSAGTSGGGATGGAGGTSSGGGGQSSAPSGGGVPKDAVNGADASCT